MCDYFKNERYEMKLPDCCPKCGGKLDVDTRCENPIKAFLVCLNNDCDYEEDFTEEFEKAAKSREMSEESF